MRYQYFCYVFIFAFSSAYAQRGDSLLLNETKLSRPLNVHHRQLRISGGHLLALSSTQYIGNKNMPNLETGRTYTFSGIDLDVKYGLSEHLQARLVIERITEVITEPAFFDAFGFDYFILSSSSQKIGWKDPEFWFDFRLPFIGRRSDVVFNVGSSFAFMNSASKRPSLLISPSDINFIEGIEFERISTNEFLSTGNGVTRFGYGVQLKHRFKRIALNFQSTYYLPIGTETLDRWVLSDNGTEYNSESYQRQLADYLALMAGVEMQVRPWLNIAIEGNYMQSRHGWNQQKDEKILVPTATLTQVNFTYEILASKRLWLGQSLSVSINGKDVFAPLLLTTSVNYNLFL